jgi:hypothetical protein
MSTGQRKVNIFLKKFLTQQQITTNFLDYLHGLILESHQKLVPYPGIYSWPVTMRSDTVNKLSLLTPGESAPGDGNGAALEADDGHGRIMTLDNVLRTNVQVPNETGVRYHVGLRFNYYPSETEINVRTGKIMWSLFEEFVGERGEPSHVSYVDGVLQLRVDAICKNVNQVGRKVRVWLKEPLSQASGDVYEEVLVASQSIYLKHDGGNGFFDVLNEQAGYLSIGQSLTVDKTPSSPVSTTVASIGVEDSGGAGYTRIGVGVDLTAYTVLSNTYIQTGNNVITLAGTLGQLTNPSSDSTKYEIFMLGLTVTTEDLRTDEYYAYIGNYRGAGAGTNPTSFDISDQKMVPEDLGSIVNDLEDFKDYQLQRNATVLRGGGQFDFSGGDLTWNEEFQLVNPFRGIYKIAAGSLLGIATDDILYVTLAKQQPVIITGSAAGKIWVEDNTGIIAGDEVVIGDSDSTRLTGTVSAVSGTEEITLVGAPDLTGYTTAKGAWVQKTNLTLAKEQINSGVLKPDSFHKVNEEILILAVCQNSVLVFKNGVLRLEDGDIGQISNLPSGFNWINNLTELQESITRMVQNGTGVLAPRDYTLTSQIEINKNLAWVGMSERTRVVGSIADSLVKIIYDADTVDTYQKVELNQLTLKNDNGNALEIDNTGATKGMEVVLDACVLQSANGLALKVNHSEPNQWIRVRWVDSKKQLILGDVEFESSHDGDDLYVRDVHFSPASAISFGKTGLTPESTMKLVNVIVDRIDAIGTGLDKTIEVQDSYSWNDDRRIDINGRENATFRMSQIIVDQNDFANYQKADNGVIFRGGHEMTFLSGTFNWETDIQLVDPFYGIMAITAGSISGLINGNILYTKFYKSHFIKTDGSAIGEVTVELTDDFNDNDAVILGDADGATISGFVFGAPSGETIIVDDGAGTPIDLSTVTKAQGGWIRRVNGTIFKGDINTSALKPDKYGNLDPQIYVIASIHNGAIIFKNGIVLEKMWIYEESFIVDSQIDIDDEIMLPLDSRNAFIQKKYRNGAAHVTVYLNGVMAQRNKLVQVASFDPTTYTSGTGVVSVPDSVNLALVQAGDFFVDSAGHEFRILGSANNTLGQKSFKIATGQTVVLTAGASIYRQHFKEYGNLDQWVDRIISKIEIPEQTLVTIRVSPIDRIGGSSGGQTPGLNDCYATNPLISIMSGVPIVLSGPAGEKLLRILGDMEVTGMLDPKGMTLSRNVARPWASANDGIWANAVGQPVWYNKTTGTDELLGGQTTVVEKAYQYTGTGQLISGSVVTKAGLGLIDYADYNTQEGAAILGLLLETLNQDDVGAVRYSGYVEASLFSAANFVENALPADKAWLWLHASGKMTVTGAQKGTGKWMVLMGQWDTDGMVLRPTILGVA